MSNTAIEPQAIGGLLRAIDDFPGTFIVKAGLQLLALIFLRPSEVRLEEWSEIDFAEKVWRIPSKRMEMRLDHMVPLSAQALAVLQTLQEVTGHEKLMFPGLRSPRVPISDATFIAALRRMGYDKEEMTAHGFRAMAFTLLNEQGTLVGGHSQKPRHPLPYCKICVKYYTCPTMYEHDPNKVSMSRLRLAYELNDHEAAIVMAKLWPHALFPLEL